MAKSPRTGTRRRRTVREELTNPVQSLDSVNGEESMSEFHNNEEPEPEPAPRLASAPRLSLPLTADGTAVDWERVRNADKARSVLGLSGGDAPTTDDGVFGADMIGLALDMLGSGLVSVARAGGYTAESSEVMRFQEQEKAAIIPRATKVLGKHAPALGRWEDEIALAVTLSVVFGGKLMQLKKAATVSKFPQRVPEPDPRPTVIDPAGGPVQP